ncbi:hypothetical protein [Shewanella sp. NKUCC06_TVS]|uniref:hypothetical protein n=1 Tax=Shewanella sp. NKUCC06_TVS TaxID=2842128 RepID=UPI001C5A725C|nr:hypothetical protein [Shewanella sp. NKUCC06_TVS]MBW3530701.1 hypothetical protein [Shewanella sp. NKUCC06_TVS]
MYAQKKKSDKSHSKSAANSVTQKKANTKQSVGFVDNRAGSIFQPQVQGKSVVQLKGSHGKHLYFKVTTITITNSVTKAVRFENANHDEDLGKVPTHGAGPAKKTQADADAIAAGFVTLAANEAITDVTWNHYTKS